MGQLTRLIDATFSDVEKFESFNRCQYILQSLYTALDRQLQDGRMAQHEFDRMRYIVRKLFAYSLSPPQLGRVPCARVMFVERERESWKARERESERARERESERARERESERARERERERERESERARERESERARERESERARERESERARERESERARERESENSRLWCYTILFSFQKIIFFSM